MFDLFAQMISSPFGIVLAFLPVSILSAYWVYVDAKRLHSNQQQYGDFNNIGPLGWAIMVLLFWIFAFPMYLIKRPLFKKLYQLHLALQNGKIDQQSFEQERQRLLSTNRSS